MASERISTNHVKIIRMLCQLAFMDRNVLEVNRNQILIAYRFKTSASNVSTVLSYQIPFLAREFQGLNNWPSQENVTKFYPKAFKLLPKVCSIMDCAERYFHKSSMAEAQTLTYSSYKSHGSSKYLVRLYGCKLCFTYKFNFIEFLKVFKPLHKNMQ